MHIKVPAICATLLAFVIAPAMASASPELQTSGGVKVATGTVLKETNAEPIVMTTTSGNITCTSATLEGPLITNSGKAIEGEIDTGTVTGAGTSGRCKSSVTVLGGEVQYQWTLENLKWCKVTTSSHTWYIRGGSCTQAASPIALLFHAYLGGTLIGTCTYTRTALAFTYVTNQPPVRLASAEGQTFTGPSGFSFCPSSGTLDAKFVVSTSSGGELQIV
jgi:hypothetical protein